MRLLGTCEWLPHLQKNLRLIILNFYDFFFRNDSVQLMPFSLLDIYNILIYFRFKKYISGEKIRFVNFF